MSHVDQANQYIDDVLNDRIPACEYVKMSCRRQLNDLERDFAYRFDDKAANRVCQFIEMLPHIKGALARKKEKIRLENWQCFVLTTVFGWLHKETNLRRYKTIYEELARKNAKSTKLSGVGLYLLSLDNEEGAEVYSAATTRDQARIVWQDSKRMAEKTPNLKSQLGVDTSAHTIFVQETSSVFRPLSRDQGGNHDGLNVHAGLIDELHAHKTRELFDVIETATGARDQPLIWAITTAGFNRAGICYEQRDYAIKILKGVQEDDEYFSIIYTVDDKDLDNMDALLSDERIWMKANPNWGVSVNPDDIARKARKAREVVSAQNNFLTKHLCVWTNADSAWMNMALWDRCADQTLDIDDFHGVDCYKGTDLASKIDIASDVTVFVKKVDGEDHYYVFDRHFLPEDQIENSVNAQYDGWERSGYITSTPGNVIDFDLIEDGYIEDAKRFNIVECAFDPFQATQFSTRMIREGLPMIEVGATVRNFSEPMKQLEALVISGRLHHNGNPVLSWMISNVVCHLDKKDNIYPNKEFPQNKIDGVVAMLMAFNRIMAADENAGSFADFLNDPIALEI